MRLVPPFIYDDSRLFYMHEMQTIVFSMTQVGNIRSFNLTSKKKRELVMTWKIIFHCFYWFIVATMESSCAATLSVESDIF
jgi:hypothetical protein